MLSRRALAERAKALSAYFSPRRIVRDLEHAPVRRAGLERLAALSRAGGRDAAYGRVLVDGTWDNANYWYRYALLRNALGLHAAEETGLIGRWRRQAASRAFRSFDIRAQHLPPSHQPAAKHIAAAREMLRGVNVPGDIARLAFPDDFPWEVFYDGVLKRQLRGSVDVRDPALAHYLAEQLAAIENARHVIEAGRYDFVVLSHCINFELGALAWLAVRMGVPVVVLYGDFGHQRFMKIRDRRDFFDFVNRPALQDFEGMPEGFRRILRERGTAYFERRFVGASGDLGARFAHRADAMAIDRNAIAARMGWDVARPIVCVYASNWFDFPHSCEIRHFLDFQDWIEATLEIARNAPQFNWLFKAHPCDTWYAQPKGPTLAQLVRAVDFAHVGMVPNDWGSLDLMRAIDGAVTYLGTIGAEMAALGRPVLVADDGWYGRNGFVRRPESRADYLRLLREPWWLDHESEVASARALEFAGAYFCAPAWQRGLVLEDDSGQDSIFRGTRAFIDGNGAELAREIGMIRDWMAAPDQHFHTYKILQESSEWHSAGAGKAAA
jgi:hypothetical protein